MSTFPTPGARLRPKPPLAGVSTLGNTSGTTGLVAGNIILAGGNNVTLSQSVAGQSATITISAGAGGGGSSLGVYGVGNTAGQSSSSTVDSRSLSFDGAGIVSVGLSGGSVVISATSGFTQSNQTLGMFAVGNTTTSTSSMTADARSLSFDGAGLVSVGMSGGSVVISASSAAQTNQTLGLVAVGNTTTSTSSMTADARSLSFDGAGIVSVGMSGGSVVISASDAAQTNQTLGLFAVGNTTGASSSTTADARTLSFDGAGMVSVGYSAGSAIVSGPPILSAFEPHQLYSGIGQSLGQNSLWFDPFLLPSPLTVSNFNVGLSISGAASVATTATVAGSYNLALYTRQTGASSTRLSSIFSTQATFSGRFSSNVSNTFAFNGVSAATGTATNLMSGNKIAQIPCVTFLQPGEYWAAMLISTASTGSAALSVSNVLQVENLSTWGQAGATLNSQGYLDQFMAGRGTFSVTTGGFPSTLAVSAISAATSGVPYYNLRNFGTI